MLHLILGVAGLAGGGGIIALIVKFGLQAVLAAAGGFVRRVPPWAWLAIGAALVIAWSLHSRAQWKALADDRAAQLAVICQATRDAAGEPKLACGQVTVQIKLLGQGIVDLKDAIGRQNAAVASLGAKTKAQQAEAAKAAAAAQGRADAALATAGRLAASAGIVPPPGAACAPSKALQESWK